MSVSVQESLLDMGDDSPVLGSLGASVRRTPLARGAWVDFCPGWLTGSAGVFGALVETVPWRAEQRKMYDRVVAVPRLLCFYGEDASLPDPVLTAAREALNAHYGPELGEPFLTAGLCLYRDGRDSVAWHGDTIGRGQTEDTMVAIVSLGSPRVLALRPRGGGASLGLRSGMGICWSWAAAASAPGSTPYPRRPRRSGRGSACSSGRGACAEGCLYCGMCFNCVRVTPPRACGRGRAASVPPTGARAWAPTGGAQAELLRVPFADASCIRVPGSPLDELEDDFVLLADAFVAGWHATELAFMQPGCTVAVFGAGTIGLLAAYSALLRGAAEVYVVDHVAERLDMAGALGATPVAFGDGDPVEQCDLMPLHVRQLEADAAGLGCARP